MAGGTWWRMRRMAANSLMQAARTQRLRVAAMVAVLASMWALVGGLALGLLLFLGQEEFASLKPRLVQSLLALFFLALWVFVTASNAVLVWAALFRTRSASFHAALPLTDRALWWGATAEGGFWASWSVVALAAPLLAALATDASSPLPFAAAATASVAAFLAVCIAGGALAAMLLARLIPIARRHLRAVGVLTVAAALAVVAGATHAYAEATPAQVIGDVIGRLRFAEGAWLPSWWVQQAVLGAQAGRWADWGHHTVLLTATAAALAVVGEGFAARRLRLDLDALSSRPDTATRPASRPWRLPPLIPADLALLAAKDLRLFRRDPAQLLQFAAFFGLLAFYMLMLPRMGRAFAEHEWWRPVVSLLNLAAVSMALATFTGRFVYPLLALEGRRLWVLALAPWPRHRVVTAKLVFALAVGLPVSVGLVSLSGLLLRLPPLVVAYQALVVACLALGLSAGALGLGARLGDYREDNPGKLVAGFGGTVNLLASLGFTALLLAGAALPLLTRAGAAGWALGLGWTLAATALWTWICLRLAWRWFGDLERL